jgi:hypothetical protein
VIWLAQAADPPEECPVSCSLDPAERGERRYMRECEACQGADPGGGLNGGAPPSGQGFVLKFASGTSATPPSSSPRAMPPTGSWLLRITRTVTFRLRRKPERPMRSRPGMFLRAPSVGPSSAGNACGATTAQPVSAWAGPVSGSDRASADSSTPAASAWHRARLMPPLRGLTSRPMASAGPSGSVTPMWSATALGNSMSVPGCPASPATGGGQLAGTQTRRAPLARTSRSEVSGAGMSRAPAGPRRRRCRRGHARSAAAQPSRPPSRPAEVERRDREKDHAGDRHHGDRPADRSGSAKTNSAIGSFCGSRTSGVSDASRPRPEAKLATIAMHRFPLASQLIGTESREVFS